MTFDCLGIEIERDGPGRLRVPVRRAVRDHTIQNPRRTVVLPPRQ